MDNFFVPGYGRDLAMPNPFRKVIDEFLSSRINKAGKVHDSLTVSVEPVVRPLVESAMSVSELKSKFSGIGQRHFFPFGADVVKYPQFQTPVPVIGNSRMKTRY